MLSAKTRHELAEDVEFMLETDHPLRVVARLGRKPSAVARALYREGRPDLARPFARIDQRQRRAAPGFSRPSRAKSSRREQARGGTLTASHPLPGQSDRPGISGRVRAVLREVA